MEAVLKKYRNSKLVFDNYFADVKQNKGFHRPLLRKERKKIVCAITDWMILKGILLRRSDYPKIFEKIRDVFPKEAGFVYYKPPRMIVKVQKSSDDEDLDQQESNENVEGLDEDDKNCDGNDDVPNKTTKTPMGNQKEKGPKKGSKKSLAKKSAPSGLLYSAYRYRINKKRLESKIYNNSTKSLYRQVY